MPLPTQEHHVWVQNDCKISYEAYAMAASVAWRTKIVKVDHSVRDCHLTNTCHCKVVVVVVVVVEDLIPRLWSYKIRTCYEQNEKPKDYERQNEQ